MIRRRSLQLTALLFAGSAFNILICFYVLYGINSYVEGPYFFEGSLEGLERLATILSFVAMFFCLWVIISFSYRTALSIFLEATSILLILVSIIPLFAASFSLHFAADGQRIEPAMALQVSTMTFIGGGHPHVTVPETAAHLVVLQSILGYLVVPMLVTLFFMLVERMPSGRLKP